MSQSIKAKGLRYHLSMLMAGVALVGALASQAAAQEAASLI
jgi:hypothetical protein